MKRGELARPSAAERPPIRPRKRLPLLRTLSPLTDHRSWLGFFTYALVFFSAFTIAGVSTATGLLFAAVLYHLWREKPKIELPRWLLAALLALPAAALLSALSNPDPLGNIAALGKEYQIFLPLALIPALRRFRDIVPPAPQSPRRPPAPAGPDPLGRVFRRPEPGPASSGAGGLAPTPRFRLSKAASRADP